MNYLLLYVDKGVFHLEQKGKHVLKAGDCLVMKLSEEHKYYSDLKEGASLYWMHFGKTDRDALLDYFYKMKMNYAKNTLKYSNASIGVIASDLGFESQSHFTRVFKRYVGMNPSAYRKKV